LIKENNPGSEKAVNGIQAAQVSGRGQIPAGGDGIPGVPDAANVNPVQGAVSQQQDSDQNTSG